MRDPLVPAHVDLRDYAFMPLEVGRLRDSSIVDEVSGDEFRAAILLWCASWHQVPAGSLPKDPKQLSKFAGYGRVVAEWEKVADGALYGWVECSDGRLYHPVIAEKALEAWDRKAEFGQKREARSDQARAAAEARWSKREATEASSSQTPDEVEPTEDALMLEQCASIPGALPKGTAKGQGKQLASAPRATELRSRITEAFNDLAPNRLPPDTNRAAVWLAQGYDPELILSVIREVLARKPDVGSLSYFDKRLAEARVRFTSSPDQSGSQASPGRRADAPAPLPDPMKYRRGLIELAAEHYRGNWRDTWPNMHRPDHPDCVLPDDVLDEARAIVAAEEASKSDPEEFARLRGFVPDRPRRHAAGIH